MSGVTYDGVVLMVAGDNLSGEIHDELTETNEDSSFSSLLFWSEMIGGAINLLADEFGKVYVVASPGNHPRNSPKPRAKLRAKNNMDWLLMHMVAREFKSDERVTFNIPETIDVHFEIYGRGHLLAHGDQAKGGGGIGGIWPPVKRLRAKLAEHANAINKPFDTLWLGHWHQYVPTRELVVNGTLKGWDEFAKSLPVPFQEPSQTLCIATPEHGITWAAPVFCRSKKEKW
jgi:hypothetical protein